MKVTIKSFDVAMEVKSKGIEFEVREPDGKFLGDCFLTKSGLIWCAGKRDRKNGKKVNWDKLIRLIEES